MPERPPFRADATTFCRICECLCGLQAQLDDGRVAALRPDAEHVATDGFACVKGLKQHRLYASPDRLQSPEKRLGGRWVPLRWQAALGEVGSKLAAMRRLHGPDAIAMYVGTAAGFSVLHPIFAQGFMTGLGSRSMYSSASQDCANKFAVARHLYGFPFTQPFPDLDHCECLIVCGANPLISKWSFLQVPNPGRRLKELVARGGRLVFVDPRRTESAKVAGEHLPIRPGTDVFFFLSFLHEVLARGVDETHLRRTMSGIDEIIRVADPWPAERTAEVTGIPAPRLQQLVDSYTSARGAALYSSTGVNMGRNGSLAFWLQEVINAVSGNLDRRGGTLVGEGVIDFPAFGKKRGLLMRDDRSRVGGFSAVNDTFPGGTLADEILTPGRGKIRALIVTGGNPLITMPNSNRLREALQRLELLVTVDIQRGETASVAHYNLPAVAPLERPDLPFVFPLMLGLQRRPYLQATEALQAPPGEARDEASIYLDLCRAAGVSLFGSRTAQRILELAARRSARHGRRDLPQRWILSLLLRATGSGSFRELLATPHGRLRPPHRPGSFLGARVLTDDGRLRLAPPELLSLARERLEPTFAAEQATTDELRLITRRAVTTHNSWTHNLAEFTRGRRETNYLYMHPEDADRRGLEEGALVDVRSATGVVRVPMTLCADLVPGAVALPHGWGHQGASGLSVARETKGVNANILAADGQENLEPLSGMAHLTGIPVAVTKAAGPRDTRDWSGKGIERSR